MVLFEKIQQFDETALLKLQRKLHRDGLDRIMKAISLLGNAGLIWIAAAAALILNAPSRQVGELMLISLAVCAFLTNIAIKLPIRRARPFERIGELCVLVKLPRDYSFPSGHTSASFAAARILMLAAPGSAALAALVFAILMGISRMYVGVHYLTDVLAGMALGIFTSQLVWQIANIYSFIQVAV
ncbi:MAG: phosphatase PAP2 family protein [Butyricicoccaceae bacterium]